METIAAYMAANPSMESFLANPVMEEKQKKDVLSKLGKEADFHPFTSNFLNLLVDKKRIGNIADIVEEFENLYCESTDTQVRARPFPAPVPPPTASATLLLSSFAARRKTDAPSPALPACRRAPLQIATVTSAVKLENEQQFMIAKKIQEMTGAKNIKLKPEVDPALLGGFVVTYGKDGSGFIDMSVAGQVAQLKNEVVVV